MAVCNLNSWLSGAMTLTLMEVENMTTLGQTMMENSWIGQESGMLTQLRQYLGSLPHSSDSTETQDSARYVEANPQGYYAYTNIALSVLRHTFTEAAYMFVHTDGKMSHDKLIKLESSKQALAFISGTGLDILLQEYGLDYNADNLRRLFYQTLHVKPSS